MTNELTRRDNGRVTGNGKDTSVSSPYPSVNLIEVAQQTQQIQALGETLIASGLLPDGIKKPEAAVAVMIKGQEIGLPPMYALSHISIIGGKPAMSAESMLAMVLRSGHIIRIVETSAERCVAEGVRANDPNHPTRITWSMDEAKTAGLTGKGPWKTFPRAMLRARAISELCRAMFADVLSGVSYVPEELGAVVNEEGEVVETPDVDAQEKDIEEAEVVEEEDEPDHDGIVTWIDEQLQKAPDGYFGGNPLEMSEYARTDLRKAMVTQQKMLRILDEGGVEAAQAS